MYNCTLKIDLEVMLIVGGKMEMTVQVVVVLMADNGDRGVGWR